MKIILNALRQHSTAPIRERALLHSSGAAGDVRTGTVRNALLALVSAFILCTLALGGLTASTQAYAQTVRYSYDEAGRLKSVTSPTNETAEYVYDAAGNITQIRRTAANVPAVTDFYPNSGPVGSSVTIVGANFGTTVAANTVRFNGTLATVTTASSVSLVATVPAGATSGPISVQTASGTGTSAQSFTVSAAGPQAIPTIASFTPSRGLPGATITITGTNFDTTPGMTKVYLNQTLAIIQSMTSTSITVRVPDSAGGGRLRVVTLAGTATSAGDFLVLIPSSVSAFWDPANYADMRRIVLDGATGSLNVTAPSNGNRWVAILFEGGPDAHASIDFTSFTASPAAANFHWEVRNTRNELMSSASFENLSVSSSRRTVHVPPMPLSGTYTLLVHLFQSQTLNITAKLRTDPTLPVDASVGTPFASSFPGQHLRFTFDATTGQSLGLGIAGQTTAPTNNGQAYYVVRDQDWKPVRVNGNPFAPLCTSPAATCGGNLPELRGGGTYSLIVASAYGSGMTGMSGTLWLSSDLVIGPVSPDTNTDVPQLKVGQNARILFTAASGERYGASLSNVVFDTTNTGAIVGVDLRAPDGTTITSLNAQNSSVQSTPVIRSKEFPALTPGTHTLFVDPVGGLSGTLRVRLWRPVVGALSVNGSSLAANLIEGQTARFSFSLSSPQALGIGFLNLASAPSNSFVSFAVLRPDDTVPNSVWQHGCFATSNGCDMPNGVPTVLSAGDYVVRVTPSDDRTSTSATVIASTNLSVSLMPAGSTVPVAVTRRGQKASLGFTATAGQARQVAVSGWQTQPVANNGTQVFIRKPSGIVQHVNDFGVANFTVALSSTVLNETGAYELIFDQFNGLTFSFSATLAP